MLSRTAASLEKEVKSKWEIEETRRRGGRGQKEGGRGGGGQKEGGRGGGGGEKEGGRGGGEEVLTVHNLLMAGCSISIKQLHSDTTCVEIISC